MLGLVVPEVAVKVTTNWAARSPRPGAQRAVHRLFSALVLLLSPHAPKLYGLSFLYRQLFFLAFLFLTLKAFISPCLFIRTAEIMPQCN